VIKIGGKCKTSTCACRDCCWIVVNLWIVVAGFFVVVVCCGVVVGRSRS
jgi:hypothetical protein